MNLRPFCTIAAASFLQMGCLSGGAADPPKSKPPTVTDYFLMLPPDYLEGKPADWLRFLRQPKCGVEDVANGYLSCTGDGAQPSFEVALFRFQDGRPLLAVCQGELEGPASMMLEFFELRPKGGLQKVARKIFPVKDSEFPINEKTAHRFELPRKGRTIVVRELRSGKVLGKYTWNGAKFVEEK